jgi:hypothetical protein
MEIRRGKCPGEPDYDVLLTGPTRITKMDDRPLCVYLPGVLKEVDAPGVYDILHDLRKRLSRNRGLASGSPRFGADRTTSLGNTSRTYTRPISSAIIGAIDPTGQQRYCRLTAWTGKNMPQWQALQPLFVEIAGHLAEHVPDRYHAQHGHTQKIDPAWVIPGTPFTTITVNNSYPTGTHTDSGDLDAGFSTIACLRRGSYTGGRLVFPQYRLAVDMGHGDLILMDAHEWHGNTLMTCSCGTRMNGYCSLCDSERISVVSYCRTKLVGCGTPEEERRKGEQKHDQNDKDRLARRQVE